MHTAMAWNSSIPVTEVPHRCRGTSPGVPGTTSAQCPTLAAEAALAQEAPAAEGAVPNQEKTVLSRGWGGERGRTCLSPAKTTLSPTTAGALGPAELLPGVARAKAGGQAGSLGAWVDLSTPKCLEIVLR